MHENQYAEGRCTYCGKWTYKTRKAARTASAKIHPGSKRLSAYECHRAKNAGFSGMWHFGHLTVEMVHGEKRKPLYHGA